MLERGGESRFGKVKGDGFHETETADEADRS